MDYPNKEAERTELAKQLFVALVGNPERYAYITNLVEKEGLSNFDATEKNVNKAFKLAEHFMQSKYK